MPLIKHGDFAADPWVNVEDEAPLPERAPAIVSLARFRKESEALLARALPLGLRLKCGESPVALGKNVHSFALVAIEFPKFGDGRGFSYARRLREQVGFRGEIRATGHFLPDQAQFLDRCGFTELQVKDGARLEDWQRGLTEFSVWYQAVGDRRPRAMDLRLQRRERRPTAEGERLSLSRSAAVRG